MTQKVEKIIDGVRVGPALTWDDLADLYPGRARIRPMEKVAEWAEK